MFKIFCTIVSGILCSLSQWRGCDFNFLFVNEVMWSGMKSQRLFQEVNSSFGFCVSVVMGLKQILNLAAEPKMSKDCCEVLKKKRVAEFLKY